MKNLGLTNNFWVYILPTAVQPFYIILCKTFVESIPKDLESAAADCAVPTIFLPSRAFLPRRHVVRTFRSTRRNLPDSAESSNVV